MQKKVLARRFSREVEDIGRYKTPRGRGGQDTVKGRNALHGQSQGRPEADGTRDKNERWDVK
jgi:hypothetical protein